MKLSWGLLLFLGFAGTDAKKGKNKDDSPKTANQKLKKLTRDTMKIMNHLYTTEVTKKEMQDMKMLGRGSGDRGRADGHNGMISTQLYRRMLKKYFNQIKFIRKKINSMDCGEFSGGTIAEDMRADAYLVWGNHNGNDLEDTLEAIFSENISEEQKDSLFNANGALFGNDADAPFNMLWTGIPDYLMPDNTQAVRGIKQKGDKPLTLLSIQFMKTRLFIQEHVGKCYDPEIAQNVVKKNASAEKRIKNWVNKGQKKFNTMEERVCKNLWKGLIRTMPDDNPYKDIDGVEGCSCTPKGEIKTLSCEAKLKEAERKEAKAAEREAKKKAKQAKQTVEDAE